MDDTIMDMIKFMMEFSTVWQELERAFQGLNI